MRAIPLVMLSDCRSLAANLTTEAPSRVQDKRLQIELDAMRQSILDGDGRRTTEVYANGGRRLTGFQQQFKWQTASLKA